jgi:hypothetical protein
MSGAAATADEWDDDPSDYAAHLRLVGSVERLMGSLETAPRPPAPIIELVVAPEPPVPMPQSLIYAW